MNFGEGFQKCFFFLYTEVHCTVTDNDYALTAADQPRKRISTTLPLIPLLYILTSWVAETLANLMYQDLSTDSLFSQNADDATLILLGEYSIFSAFEMITIIKRRVQAENKTKGIWLGSKEG